MITRNFKLLPVFRSSIRSCLGLSSVAESNLAKLRRKTGFSFILCKKALELYNNDLDAAAAYLEEESVKQGYIKAAKLQTRKTVHGLIGVYLNQQAGRCALLELNCETDFVARNSNFIELTSQLTRESLSFENDEVASTGDNQLIRKITTNGSPSIQDRISQAITKLGENIKLTKSIVLQFDPDLLTFHHAHASGDFIPDYDGVKLGKYGAVVFVRQQPVKPENQAKTIKPPPKEEVVTSQRQLTDEEIDNEEFEFIEEQPTYTTDDIGKILCLQIIGMRPEQLKKPTDQTENRKKISDDDTLLNQKIIVDPTLTVANFCDNHGIKVLDFVRIECGDDADLQ